MRFAHAVRNDEGIVMFLKAIRFVAIMLAALTLGLGFCHLMQLPARMEWDQYLWVGSTVQGGLYAMFGSIGAVMFVATVIALGLNAYFVREHGRPGFGLALSAAIPVRAGAGTVVGAGLPRQCRAGEMGQRASAFRLDRVSCALGMGPRDHFARRACGLRRVDWLGAGRHLSSC